MFAGTIWKYFKLKVFQVLAKYFQVQIINIGIGEKCANFLFGVWLPYPLPDEEQEGGKRGTSTLPALMIKVNRWNESLKIWQDFVDSNLKSKLKNFLILPLLHYKNEEAKFHN